ncbi:hypothetical protein OTU49_002691 [Cherax quadricarinatus]|uniref:Uncharacterized protein n=1 Tax=Cherax quadricarinatus TaxID=27406 RepID=A0AAW0X8V0_CHEQU
MAPGAQGCPCPCLTGVEMTLRVRGCRAGRTCACEGSHQPSPCHTLPKTAESSPKCQPQSDSFLAVAATAYTGLQRLPLPSPYIRPAHTVSGPVLPSSHLLDHLNCKRLGGPHVSIAPSQPPSTRNTLDIPQTSFALSSRSIMDGDHHTGTRGAVQKEMSSHSWMHKSKPWSLPRVPKRPGRFSSRRNRSTNASSGSAMAAPPFRHSTRTSNSHPDFREFRF